MDIALRVHTKIDIGIFGMGLAKASGADLEDQCGRLAAVLQVMAITLTGFEAESLPIESVDRPLSGKSPSGSGASTVG